MTTGRKKRPSQRGPTEYQKEEKSHKKTGVPASNRGREYYEDICFACGTEMAPV
jgi:hypothetical protein